MPPDATASVIAAVDGARLRVVRFPLPDGAPARRGTVLIHPGWSEFSEKYVEMAGDLHRRGFGVVVFDPRGQGYSQRLDAADRRGHIDDFRKFVGDLSVVMDHVRATETGPVVLLAHSMGGLITLEWLIEGHGSDLAGVVLSAPLTNLFQSRLKRVFVAGVLAAGKALGRGAAALPGVKEHSWTFDGNVLTQDPSRHERFRQLQLSAPDAVAGLPKFDWLHAALAGMKRIQAPGAMDRLSGPILLVSAAQDETVDPTHHHRLAADYPDLFDLVIVPGARHELMMEADAYRDQFFAAFDQYIDERVPGTSKADSSVPRT